MTDLSEHNSMVATRSYERKGGSRVKFCIGVPYAAEGEHGIYKCDYIVEIGPRKIARTVEGIDGLCAFFLCLSSIRRWIVEAEIVDPLLYRWDGANEWGDLGLSLPA